MKRRVLAAKSFALLTLLTLCGGSCSSQGRDDTRALPFDSTWRGVSVTIYVTRSLPVRLDRREHKTLLDLAAPIIRDSRCPVDVVVKHVSIVRVDRNSAVAALPHLPDDKEGGPVVQTRQVLLDKGTLTGAVWPRASEILTFSEDQLCSTPLAPELSEPSNVEVATSWDARVKKDPHLADKENVVVVSKDAEANPAWLGYTVVTPAKAIDKLTVATCNAVKEAQGAPPKEVPSIRLAIVFEPPSLAYVKPEPPSSATSSAIDVHDLPDVDRDRLRKVDGNSRRSSPSAAVPVPAPLKYPPMASVVAPSKPPPSGTVHAVPPPPVPVPPGLANPNPPGRR